MKKRLVVNLMMAFLVAGLLLTVSCAKKTVVSDATKVEDQTATQTTVQDQAAADDQARKDALAEEQRIAEENLRAAKAAAEKRRFSDQNIHFAFDSSELSSMAMTLLKEKAEFLKNNTGVSVTIEGHCDERGTTEYNLALGERRAQSAKNYLVNLGISASRLNTVSYGEERPLDPGHGESAWQKNRRAHFVIK